MEEEEATEVVIFISEELQQGKGASEREGVHEEEFGG